MKTDREKSGDRFTDITKQAIEEGKLGRRELIEKLAAMSLEELSSVSPSAMALIGPRGLAMLAAGRADLAGLAPKPTVEAGAKSPERETREGRAQQGGASAKPRQFLTLWWSSGIVAVAMAFDLLSPMVAPRPLATTLSRNASEWPRCKRLDRLTEACVYRTGGGGRLTLEGAADNLGMTPDGLALLNSHLAAFRDRPLPPDSLVVVLRDFGRLSGGTRWNSIP